MAKAIPVGVTVARKRHQESRRRNEGSALSDDDSIARSIVEWEECRRDLKQGSTSWRVLLESLAIYTACLFLPSIVALMVEIHGEYRASHSLSAVHETNQGNSSWIDYCTGLALYAKEETISYLCASTDDQKSFADMFGASSWICTPKKDPMARIFLWAEDAQWTDLGTVAFLSLTLAVIRIVILLAIVPLKEPDRLSAVMRCKSIHLLSRDYQLTPHGTPVVSRKTPRPCFTQDHLDSLKLPNMNGFERGTTVDPPENWNNDLDDDNSQLGLSLDDSQRDLAVGLDDNIPFQEMTPLPSQDSFEFLNESGDANVTINDRVNGFNSPPRLATASFRLIYSALAVSVAFYFFSDSDFWPVHLGGSGKTAACWDLSGGLSVGGMDGDFDALNTALRWYYLQQASYHWHSGAFHLLSVLLVLTRPREKRLEWIRDSASSYKRSLLQHSVAILLLSTTYVFSSLRRLGAIGMFAFDLSSLFLHFLQVCMNSDKSTFLRTPRWITFVYRFLVLPSFLYCRFLVWPILWWSAFAESEKWLIQFDRILFPGASILLQTVWHTCMGGAMVLNLVYLRRLLNHPHLSRIKRSRHVE